MSQTETLGILDDIEAIVYDKLQVVPSPLSLSLSLNIYIYIHIKIYVWSYCHDSSSHAM